MVDDPTEIGLQLVEPDSSRIDKTADKTQAIELYSRLKPLVKTIWDRLEQAELVSSRQNSGSQALQQKGYSWWS